MDNPYRTPAEGVGSNDHFLRQENEIKKLKEHIAKIEAQHYRVIDIFIGALRGSISVEEALMNYSERIAMRKYYEITNFF